MCVADGCIVGTDDQVTAQDEFQGAGVTVPVNLGDDGLRQRFERVDCLGLEVWGGSFLACSNGPKIVASAERPAGTPENDDSYRGVVRDRVDVIAQLDKRRRVHGVQLVGPVERQRSYAICIGPKNQIITHDSNSTFYTASSAKPPIRAA